MGNLIVDCRRRQVRSGKEFVEAIEELTKSLKLTGGRLECKTLAGTVVRQVGYEFEKPKKPTRPYRGGGRRGPGQTPGYRPPPVNVWDDPTK
jgi:hypothetical protein